VASAHGVPIVITKALGDMSGYVRVPVWYKEFGTKVGIICFVGITVKFRLCLTLRFIVLINCFIIEDESFCWCLYDVVAIVKFFCKFKCIRMHPFLGCRVLDVIRCHLLDHSSCQDSAGVHQHPIAHVASNSMGDAKNPSKVGLVFD